MQKGINSPTVVRVCWWGTVRTVTKTLWPTSYLTHMLVAPRLSGLSALITSLLSFPSLPALAAPVSFYLTHFSQPTCQAAQSALVQRSSNASAWSSFLPWQIDGQAMFIPCWEASFGCLMPGLFRVSTGIPCPALLSANSVCLSLEPPGSASSASQAQALRTLWMPVCFITPLASWEVLQLPQDHPDGNAELGLWQGCSLATCYQQWWLVPHPPSSKGSCHPALSPAPVTASPVPLNCSASIPAPG